MDNKCQKEGQFLQNISELLLFLKEIKKIWAVLMALQWPNYDRIYCWCFPERRKSMIFLKNKWQPVLIHAVVFSCTEKVSEKGNIENSGLWSTAIKCLSFY